MKKKSIDPFKTKQKKALAHAKSAQLSQIIARHQDLERRLAEAKTLYGEYDELTEYLLQHQKEVLAQGGTINDNFHPTGKVESNKQWKSVAFNRYTISWR